MTVATPQPALDASAPNQYIRAFEKTAVDRAALRPQDLQPVNVDVQRLIPVLLRACRRLATHRDSVMTAFTSFDMAAYDSVPVRVEALARAQVLFRAAVEPAEELPALRAAGLPLRARLRADAVPLVTRGLIDGRPLAKLTGGPGYLNLGADLAILAHLLRRRWTKIAGKVAVTPADLAAADAIYERINAALAKRRRQSEMIEKASDERDRAFTLVVRAYDQARRALTYVRWGEGDLEVIAPSIYAGRRRRSAKATDASGGVSPAAQDVPAAVSPSAGAGGHLVPVPGG
jgi:hypothetical protein